MRQRVEPGDSQLLQNLHHIEFVEVEEAQNFSAEWQELASRALEPNVFLEPSFALAAARHIPGASRPKFLLVWERSGTELRGRLVGLWPMVLPRTPFGAIARSWRHDFSCSCAPLLDRALAFVVLEQMTDWLKDFYPHVLALAAPLLLKAGPAYGVLRDQALSRRFPMDIVSQYDRAALDATIVGVGARDFISPKKKKELLRQFRRLREMGSVTFGVANEDDSLRDQVEAFMALEAGGWKGRQGSAFLNDPGLATFLRAMTRLMGREGKCRLYWLALDGRMIAGNIVLLGGDGVAYFWKTAYDEAFAFASPGVLLTMDMTDRLLRETRIHAADSCAIADHPMIDHIWRGRLRIADVMMALRGDRQRAFSGALNRELFRRRLREKAKSALARFRSA